MIKKQLRFYPVGNGDTTLITLDDKTTLLIDCKIREGEESIDGTKIYPVKDDLLENLKRKNGIPVVDCFILTHADEDHCLGFEKHFFTGNPLSYSDRNLQNNEIIVEELWVSAMIFLDQSNDDAKAIKKEAERRRQLWLENDFNSNNSGNRIRIIGYNNGERYQSVPNSVPGEIIMEINGKFFHDFRLFVHAPFKKHVISSTAAEDKNFRSIIMQAAFKEQTTDLTWSFFLFGGDADHYIWAEVLKQTTRHQNEDKLSWDILLAPHHCSWTFFNDVPYDAYEENKIPRASTLQILDYQGSNAKIIASCKTIKNNDDNPPHFPAKQQYINKINGNNFLNTAVEPNEKEPLPIVFEVTSFGFARIDIGERAARLRNVAQGIQAGIVGTTSSGLLSGKQGEFTKHKPHRFYGYK